MKITAKLLAIALTVMTIPLSSYAGSGNHDRCKQHAEGYHASSKLRHEGVSIRGIPPHLAALNLSDEQQDKIFQLMHAQMPKARQVDKSRHQFMEELHKLSIAVNYDEVKAEKVADQLTKIEKEAVLNRTITHHQVYQILTPEQRKQLDEIKLRHLSKPDDDGRFSKSRFERRQHHSQKLERVL